MDGSFFVNTRPPHITASYSVVNLAGTYKAIAPASAYPELGPYYMGWVGKAVRLTLWGIGTTGATPGNWYIALFWGNGTDNNGTNLVTIGIGGVANQTNQTWKFEATIRCLGTGVNGQVQTTGSFWENGVGFSMLPQFNSFQQLADWSQDYIFNVQCMRTGSTGETMQVTDLIFEELN